MNKVIWVAGVSCWINIILILRCKYVRSPDKHSSEWKKMSVICICWTIIWQYWCVCACACMLYLHWDRRLNVFSVRQQTSKHNSADTTRFHWYCCFFSENRSCQPCVWVFVCVCVWVCVKTYLNIISQTCQVASVPAIQRDNGSLGSASVRIFCDCVWICVYVSAVEGGPIMKHVTCVTFCVAFSLAFAIRVGKHTFHHLDTGAYNHAMMCTHVLDKHTKLTRAGTFTCSFIQTHKLPNTHSDFILWPYVYGDVTVTQV